MSGQQINEIASKYHTKFTMTSRMRASAGLLFRGTQRGLVLVIQAHARPFRGPINNQVRMFPPKRFSDMAVPADRPVRCQRFLQFFDGRDFVPLNGLAIIIQESWRVIMPVDFSEPFVAIDALVSLIPMVDDRPNQAGLWGLFDLL